MPHVRRAPVAADSAADTVAAVAAPAAAYNDIALLNSILYSTPMKEFLVRHKKPVIITLSVIILQLIFGFDPKFSIINIIWLFV
ncbi:MAG: hypothetical protein RL156_1519 [Bacteroidota bacterium]